MAQFSQSPTHSFQGIVPGFQPSNFKDNWHFAGTFRQDINYQRRRDPSFDRQGTSRERNNSQRGGLMTRQFVPGQNNVVVLPRTSTGQTNAIEGERTRKNEGTFRQEINYKVGKNPSFDRQGTSRERNNLQRGGLMTRQSVPGQNNVVVRPRTSTGQTNAIGDQLIAEEEAVCKRCSRKILNEANILMMKCGCRKAFIHETCDANQSTCDRCGKEVRRIPVTLSFA